MTSSSRSIASTPDQPLDYGSRDSTEVNHHALDWGTTPGSGQMNPLVEGESFTVRGVLVGLLVGLVICFSNMYFGLQTGWVSTMTLPASLMGFGIFQLLSKHLRLPFSPVENVLVQTVAGSMAIMPLGCGFVGVLPAMNYLLTEEEQGPIVLNLGQLIIWSLGLCYFGVVFAVPLRRQVIIREKLRFPSGLSTAVLISVLHGKSGGSDAEGKDAAASGEFACLVPTTPVRPALQGPGVCERDSNGDPQNESSQQDWAQNLRFLLICFAVSGTYTLCTYFLPWLRNISVFGRSAAEAWLWTLNPSPAYVGQGIIMGPETTLHMLLGAVVGWGILSPLAKLRGWAPGPVGDWEHGSKGWIVWVSLAIMLADALVSLGSLLLRYLVAHLRTSDKASPILLSLRTAYDRVTGRTRLGGYRPIHHDGSDQMARSSDGLDCEDCATPTHHRRSEDIDTPLLSSSHPREPDNEQLPDAPAEQQVGNLTVSIGLLVSIALCIATVRIVFGALMPLYTIVIAVAVALLLSIMGVRALGETDLNPVSGISKIAQLFFALIVPHKTGVVVNLIAGAISEAGALQAGELMQDLKTGHLLGAAPKAQFWGQVIGATAGAVVSALIYQLYTAAYPIPGELFQIPTGYVWIFTARLVTGEGLPPMAKEFAFAFGVLFAVSTVIRAMIPHSKWRALVPGGIAVAVGMYNVPSFTLARTIGGLLSWYWTSQWRGRGHSNTSLIVLASGFILGEGFLSVVNLILQTLDVPRLI